MDGPGRGGLHINFGLYRSPYLRRVPVSHRPHGVGRRDPVENDESGNACLHMGSRMVAGAHSHPCPRHRAVYFRGASDEDAGRYHRDMAAQAEKTVVTVRPLERATDAAPFPAYLRPHLA